MKRVREEEAMVSRRLLSEIIDVMHVSIQPSESLIFNKFRDFSIFLSRKGSL